MPHTKLSRGTWNGRFFHASDEHGPNSAPYIVLSYDFWRRHFDSDPLIVGAKVDSNKHPFTVIGVAPAAFHGAGVMVTMALLGFLATWIPARRALRIHPPSLLREE